MAPQGPSALYTLVEHELGLALFSDEAEKGHLAPFISRERMLRALEGGMSPAWFDDVSTPGIEDRQAILARALSRAWGAGAARWGSDAGRWRYGDLHSLVLQHPLGRVPYVGRLFNRGFFPVGGSATTIAAFNPSMRWVADIANPDRSLAIILGGQSEHLNDEHYDDQVKPFLNGQVHPVQWSEQAIENATVSRLRLRP
jgi:penicillin amidase